MDEPGYLNVPDLAGECAEAMKLAEAIYSRTAEGQYHTVMLMAALAVLLKRGCLSDIGIEQLRASQEKAK